MQNKRNCCGPVGEVWRPVAWIGAKIRAIRWKFLWGILQSSRALLQTLGHVSGSIVRGPAVVVLVIKIIVDYSFGKGHFSLQYVTCVFEEVFQCHECFLWKWMPFFWRKSNILENVAASVVFLWYYQWGPRANTITNLAARTPVVLIRLRGEHSKKVEHLVVNFNDSFRLKFSFSTKILEINRMKTTGTKQKNQRWLNWECCRDNLSQREL